LEGDFLLTMGSLSYSSTTFSCEVTVV